MPSIFLVFVFLSFCSASSFAALTHTVDDNGVEWYGPIRKCPEGADSVLNECMRNIVRDLKPKAGAGIPDISLLALDPFTMDRYAYEFVQGPIVVKVMNRNIRVHGLTNYDALNFTLDTKNSLMRFDFEFPLLRANTDYKVDGKAFFVPIFGAGPTTLEVFNIRLIGRMSYGKVEREDGPAVIQVTNTKIDQMGVRDMKMRVGGIMGGNPMMSGVFHYFANQYGVQIFELIRPEIGKFIEEFITANIANPVLEKLPHLAKSAEIL